MLPIGPEELTRYPAARSQITGVLMGVHGYGRAFEASTSETWFLHRGLFSHKLLCLARSSAYALMLNGQAQVSCGICRCGKNQR